MKKQKIQLIVMLVILLAFIGCFFGLKSYNEAKENEVDEPLYTAWSLDSEDIATIHVVNSTDDYELEYFDETWYFVDDAETALTQSTVTSMISDFCDITSDKVIESPENLSDYGLETPEITVTATMTDGTTHTLYIGDLNETASLYYIMIDDSDTVYTVSSTLHTHFNKTADDLIDTSASSSDASSESSSEASDSAAAASSDSTVEAVSDASSSELSAEEAETASESASDAGSSASD